MQGFKLFFAGFLGIMAILPAWGDDAADAARAATRRMSGQKTSVTSVQNAQNVRQKKSGVVTGTNTNVSATNRVNNVTGHTKATDTVSQTVVGRKNDVGAGTRGVATTRGVESGGISGVGRNATGRISGEMRTVKHTGEGQTKTNVNNTAVSRTAVIPMTAAKVVGNIRNVTKSSRNAANLGAMTTAASTRRGRTNNGARISRAATDTTQVLSADDVKNRKYSKCQTVYNECMDEFCANKDTQLKRCACSARKDEFNSVKKRLDTVEDKLLNFNQRLLTVNMSPEDVEAMNSATEGEDGYYGTKDTSESNSILNQISKKLNKSFKTSDFDTNLNSISLTLDTDAAFDSVDSLQGAATTSKTGVELYRAALPICREMAAEVCSDMDLSLAESGYQMLIEQDCNIVSKGYQSQADQAREQVFESGALLDMARLDVQQTQNSDDKLTCKKKMLDMLTDSTVCGTDLGKCLDVSGQYINPTTGQAVLSINLKNLVTLIERPTGDTKWQDVTKNKTFVNFLNDKKKYLSVATENCRDVADDVWNDFIEDALAQIKLAQQQKLDVMQQSCTTLTTQCLTDANQSIENYDSRALSVFGVVADKTSREICNEITVSCAALIEEMNKVATKNTIDWVNTDDTVNLENAVDDETWIGGMTQIAIDKTFDEIIQACTQIGKNCIINVCQSINGNFGLCENIQTSINRKAIVNRTACWNEVMDCIANAGDDALSAIIKRLAETQYENDGKISWDDKNYNDKDNSENVTNPLFKSMLGYSGFEDGCRTSSYGEYCVNERNKTPENCYLSEPDGGCIYDLCTQKCTDGILDKKEGRINNIECVKCRLTEYIWGNCNYNEKETHMFKDEVLYNKILIPTKGETLLSWFAKNTGTENTKDNCRDTTCPAGKDQGYRCSGTDDSTQECPDDQKQWGCYATGQLSWSKRYCPNGRYLVGYNNTTPIYNCCDTGVQDSWGNCLFKNDMAESKVSASTGNTWVELADTDFGVESYSEKRGGLFGYAYTGAYVDENETDIMVANPKGIGPNDSYKVIARWKSTNNGDEYAIDTIDKSKIIILKTSGGKGINHDDSSNAIDNKDYYNMDREDEFMLLCIQNKSVSADEKGEGYPSGKKLECKNGRFLIINLKTGYYFTPTKDDNQNGWIREYKSDDDNNLTILKHKSDGSWYKKDNVLDGDSEYTNKYNDNGLLPISWMVNY